MSSLPAPTRPEEQCARDPSPDASAQRKDAINLFVDDEYRPEHFNKLASTAAGMLKANAPKDEFNEDVKYQLTHRGKDRTSLEKNLRKKPNLDTREKILKSSCVCDLAGVRILTYFPDDVPKIAETITKLFNVVRKPFIQHSKMVYLDPHQPEDDAADGGEDHAKAIFERYPSGMWTTIDGGDIVRIWKHAGYRAVHFLINGVDEKIPEVGPPQDPDDAVGIPAPPSIPDIWHKLVEVQITTIVMHAWSEVQHDLIYKNLYQLPQDATIDRMVDGTNGLALTSEILLQQLQQTFTSLRSREDEVFEDDEVLKGWIFEHYFGWGSEKRFARFKSHNLVHLVVTLLGSPIFNALPAKRRDIIRLLGSCEQASPNEAEEALHSHKDGFYLLRNLLLRNEYDKDHTVENYFRNENSDFRLLYKFLLTSSMYSIWVAISEWYGKCIRSWLSLDQVKCNEIDFEEMKCFDAINLVLINRSPYDTGPSSVGQFHDPNLRSKLEVFCDDYLYLSCCDEHKMAARLAKLSFFFIDTSQHSQHLFQINDIPRMMDGKNFTIPLHFSHLTSLDYLLRPDANLVKNTDEYLRSRAMNYQVVFGKRPKLFLDWREMSQRWHGRDCGSSRIDFHRPENLISGPSTGGPFVSWINPETVRVYLQSILDCAPPRENLNRTDLAVSKH